MSIAAFSEPVWKGGSGAGGRGGFPPKACSDPVKQFRRKFPILSWYCYLHLLSLFFQHRGALAVVVVVLVRFPNPLAIGSDFQVSWGT